MDGFAAGIAVTWVQEKVITKKTVFVAVMLIVPRVQSSHNWRI